MCKRFFTIFLTLMISLSATGCKRPFSDSDMDIYEKIHKTYLNMESYSADLDLTVYSNKTENRYFVSQKHLSPDKFYTRVTDPNSTFSVTTITNGAITKTCADGSDYSLTVPSDEYMNLLFVNNFFKAYYSSEETSLFVNSSLNKSDKTILTVTLGNENINIKTVDLAIDNKTLIPVCLTAYGKNQEKLMFAKYENFKFNDKTDLSIYNTD